MATASGLILSPGAATACKGKKASKGMDVSRAQPIIASAHRARRCIRYASHVALHSPPARQSGSACSMSCMRPITSTALRTVYARLPDDGTWHRSRPSIVCCATRGTKSRRNELVRQAYGRPELLATKWCEVWSWDITKIMGRPRRSIQSAFAAGADSRSQLSQIGGHVECIAGDSPLICKSDSAIIR